MGSTGINLSKNDGEDDATSIHFPVQRLCELDCADLEHTGPARTGCSPHCTLTSETPGKLPDQLQLEDPETTLHETDPPYSGYICTTTSPSLRIKNALTCSSEPK
ncbi:hypothetical protein AALO_G00009740 [Alosa alosa]|uniref:Uncharacterized protein n=1 Tax=Alosa alosa TaxID=278164 RepID=A0AAV6HFK1_9TELE|nr:hypothetical protein AALO_G00009740 [Alosa alosa]